jgi:hypothetical protein
MATKNHTPGASAGRTSGKHYALDKFLGKATGVMTKLFQGRKMVVVDCTAGNGKASEFSRDTSPGIVSKHAAWLAERGFAVDAHLFERVAMNVEMLKSTDAARWNIHHGDASQMAKLWGDEDILFVVNDPNSMADWALPASMEQAPKMTTVFSTLGCNVGGLKRLPREEREVWFRHAEAQIALAQRWHDVLIVTLDGDASQWAYMVNAPIKWRDALEASFKAAFKAAPYGLRMAWKKDNPVQFGAIVDELFLTRKERGL